MTPSRHTLLRSGLLAGCLLTLLAGAALADAYDFHFRQGPAQMVIPVDDYRQFHSRLTNTGDNADSYTLTATRVDTPENWVYNVCFGDICYPPNETVLQVPAAGTLAAGETMDFDFDVTSLADAGEGQLLIEIVSNNDGTVAGSWTYTARTPVDGLAMLLANDIGVLGAGVNEFLGFHPILYNAGTVEDTYTLTMTRDQPENWVSTFCYGGICYPPFDTEGQIPDGEGAIASAEGVTIDIDFTTLFDEGTGSATIEIRSNTDPSLFATATYTVTTGSVVAVGDVPAGHLVHDLRAVPNPFNPRTEIRFTVGGETSRTALVDIYDPAGRRVRTLLARDLAPGQQSLAWDGRTDAGTAAGAGVYLARVQVGDQQAAVKLSLVK